MIGSFILAVVIVVLTTELGPSITDFVHWVKTGKTGVIILPLAIINIVLFVVIMIYVFRDKK
jgi:hypothetical protein